MEYCTPRILLIVLRKFLGSSGSSNGYDPTSITYNVTPHDQTSATLPSYSFLERTSGAMYAGVPTVDFGFECSKADFE
uniref:Uncharacterized protein n=1 Tax=Arundo donax TaxID=35708 RepID=A0A0A9E667_ARUDO